MYDGKGYLTTLENIWRDDSINEQPSPSLLANSFTEPLFYSKDSVGTNISNIIDMGGMDAAEKIFNYKFFEYDQENRQWENYNINKVIIDDLLTRGIEKGAQNSLFIKQLKEDIEQSKYYAYPTHSHQILYDILRNLELYSSTLKFTVDGNLKLDIGQVIGVSERGGENDTSKEQFHGQWMITKIQHTFWNAKYECHILGSRRFTFNN